METINLGSRSLVRTESIKLLKADINYTTIFFLDGTKVLVSTTMGIIESRLPREKFLRINRGTVINREMVSHYFIRPAFDEVKLVDSSFVRVSRRRRMESRKLLFTENNYLNNINL